MEREFKIKGLMMDPITNSPIVILQGVEKNTLLPIWVGIFEANAIALQIERIDTPRPMTHDLLKNILLHLDATVEKIVVTDLQDNTFFATIHLDMNGDRVTIDSRPSDCHYLIIVHGHRFREKPDRPCPATRVLDPYDRAQSRRALSSAH